MKESYTVNAYCLQPLASGVRAVEALSVVACLGAGAVGGSPPVKMALPQLNSLSTEAACFRMVWQLCAMLVRSWANCTMLRHLLFIISHALCVQLIVSCSVSEQLASSCITHG